MESIISNCESAISDLLKFSDKLLELSKPIEDNRIEEFEHSLNYELPVDFKYFLKKFNGLSVYGTKVFGLGAEFKEASLDSIYKFEHNQMDNKMPVHFLPFSNDGRGNHYCLDLSRLDKLKVCPVVFWQWDFVYKTVDDIETCNENFCDWVKEVLIGWTLEEYNFDGTKK